MTNESCPRAVLVVEDDHGIREAIGEILENEGYEVALAENGQHALELLSELERPCLLLVDLIMPRMNGWELMNALSNHDRLATIPIVVMSAANQPDCTTGQRVMKKPIDLDIMLDIVREHCCGERGSGPPPRKRDRTTPVD
jgi:two-component system, chemotaxis family, chemotaxis protein CheY